jgi:hypothetical protein
MSWRAVHKDPRPAVPRCSGTPVAHIFQTWLAMNIHMT